MLIVIAAAAALAAGLVWKVALDHSRSRLEITWAEYAIAAAAICALVVPATVWAGTSVAKNNLLDYREFWSGYETSADWTRIPCEKDGRCRQTYRCDPYWVTVTKTRTVPDGNGGTRTETYTEQEKRWRSCPYANEEWTFTVGVSFGDTYTIAAHRLPTDPEANRWRGVGYEAHHPTLARKPAGVPARWQQVRDRLDANTPGAVTAIKPYDNYLLASQRTILKAHSDAVETYRADGLLPDVARDVHDLYLADKVYAVGDVTIDERAWQDAVMWFNAALGTLRQGDLHVVVVPADLPADRYSQALQAWWSHPDLGKHSLSKNGLVLVVGTDGATVAWARAFTGMPHGNEALLGAVRTAFNGVPFTPQDVLGTPTGRLAGDDVDVAVGDGTFEQLTFADANGFERVCMTCADTDDTGTGFSYLDAEIRPTGGQQAAIFAGAFFASLAAWAAPVAAGRRARSGRWDPNHFRTRS